MYWNESTITLIEFHYLKPKIMKIISILFFSFPLRWTHSKSRNFWRHSVQQSELCLPHTTRVTGPSVFRSPCASGLSTGCGWGQRLRQVNSSFPSTAILRPPNGKHLHRWNRYTYTKSSLAKGKYRSCVPGRSYVGL